MKRLVNNYSVQIVGNDVHVDIDTDRKKPHSYRIWADTRHPNIDDIARRLDQSLAQAKQLGSKIEVREFLERMYVFIDSEQYSAAAR